jgi:hypothetical protein
VVVVVVVVVVVEEGGRGSMASSRATPASTPAKQK